MPKFSLILAERVDGEYVTGGWVKNHIGTLESASEVAAQHERLNGHCVDVAVIDELTSVTPMLDLHWRKQRLDVPRPQPADHLDHCRWCRVGRS